MTKPSFSSFNFAMPNVITTVKPDEKTMQLKRGRWPVRYIAESLPEITYAEIDDSKKITAKTIRGTTAKFLKMISAIFEAFNEEDRQSEHQWPDMLRVIHNELNTVGNLDKFLIRGHELMPALYFQSFQVLLRMERVPLFMEWPITDSTSCRVLLDPKKNQFFVLHLQYEKSPDGHCYMGGTLPGVRAFFCFSMDDLQTSSRLKTIDAAFTSVQTDEEGYALPEHTALHASFVPYDLCH